MGKLIYGDSDITVEVDDRALTHLQVVIGAKLRRGESFFFSWTDDSNIGDGRSSLWMNKSIPLYFKYYGSRTAILNRDWIAVLTDSSNSGQGLIFTAEPGGTTPAPRARI